IPWAKNRATVLKADVLAQCGKFDEAIQAVDALMAATKDNPAAIREARLTKAKYLARTKKFDESEDLVRQVIKEAPPEAAEVQALAHNTLGDCLRAAGKPKDALFAYLQTDILYDKDKEQHPRALYEIAQLWRLLKRDDRADETLERLKERYPQSPYLTNRAGAR